MATEKDLGVRVCVLFSPGISQWSRKILQNRLALAAEGCKAPIFMIQARNDATLEPMEFLGRRIEKKGGFNRTKVYPYEAKSGIQVSSLAVAGWDKWGHEVLVYLDEAMKR